jgi:hypothetical protein
MGTQGQLGHLRQIGFKTFSPWIDESYDQEPDTDLRFDLIQNEIRRVSSLPEYKLQQVLQEINAVADYNKNNYERIWHEYRTKLDNRH